MRLIGLISHIRPILPIRLLNRKQKRILLSIVILIYLVGGLILIVTLKTTKQTAAAWFDDSWRYRKSIAIATHTAAENNVFINLTGDNDIDTATLISAGKMQAGCGDLRFTKQNGELLPYHISSGCNSADTVVHVFFDSFPAGAQTIYYYYGNPSVADGFSASDFATEAANYTFGSIGSEETTPGPLLYLAFNEGQGTVVNDSSGQKNNGTISGSTWNTEDMCISGKCLYYDGTDDKVTVSNDVTNVKTVSFWTRPKSTSQPLLTLDGGTNYATVSGGIVSATGFTTPTIYVDGKATTTALVEANKWHHIEITTDTGVNSTDIQIGTVLGSYLNGFIDELKLYDYARTADQVKADYNSRGAIKGVSVRMGDNNEAMKQLSNGLVGYWKMDESSDGTGAVTRVDSSGNGNNLTDNSPYAASGGGKFGNGTDFDNSTSEYLSIADASQTGLDLSSTFTLSAWIKPESIINGAPIIQKESTNGNAAYYWHVLNDGSNGRVSFTATPGCWYGSGPNNVRSAANSLTNGVWTHLALTYDGKTLRLYMNGTEYIGRDYPYVWNNGTIGNCASPFSIGGGQANGTWTYFNGLIDESRVYNRSLSSKEVRDLYNWAPGPVGYWNFDEKTGTTANDTSGNSNTGTLGGDGAGIDLPIWSQGKYGGGLKFDGTDDYIELNNPSPLQLTGAMTASAWVYINSFTGNGRIIAKQGGTDNRGWSLAIENSAVASFGIASNITTMAAVNSTTTLSSGKWYHITGVYEPSTAVRIYINGVLDNSNTTSIPASQYNNNLNVRIGNRGDLQTWFNGFTDDVRVYNYTRTPKQIVEDMNAGHPAVGSPVGSAIGHWNFDEGYGDPVNNTGSQGDILDGTRGGTTKPMWVNDGKKGKALDFDGASSVVTVNNNNAIDFDTGLSNGVSFSSWFYADSDGEGDAGRIIDKGTNTYISVSGQSGSNLNIAASLDLGTADATKTLTAPVTTGTWNHIVMSYTDDSDDEITLYVNGKNYGSSTNGDGAPATSDTSSLYIGNNSAGSATFDGRIDEVKVYNYELTEDEVKLDYNQGKSIVMGALSDTSGLTGGSVASNSASAQYCIPGDTSTCSAPVGEWRFEEKTGTSANDTSGNSNTGTLGGNGAGTDIPSWKAGKVGGALDFDGSDDYVSVGDLDTNSITVSAWVKPSKLATNQRIISKWGNTTGEQQFVLSTDDSSSNEFTFAVRTVLDDVYEICDSSATGGTYSANQWYFVTGVYDATECKIYVNGRDVTDKVPGDTSGNIKNTATTLRIGIEGDDGTSNPFKGVIDEVKIYNYARSQAQIAWDYNKGKPVAHYRFDECQGSTISDWSGNNLHGTLSLSPAGTTTTGTCSTASSAWGGASGTNAGKFNYALNFDGTDDYVTISDNSILRPENGSWTVSVWANPPNSDQMAALVSKRQDADPWEQFSLIIAGDTGGNTSGQRLNAQFQEAYGLGNKRLVLSTQDVADGNWHNYVMIADKNADTIKLYMDGKEMAVTEDNNGSWPTVNNTDPLRIGDGNAAGGTHRFNGQIDDVKIFNYALTGVQVKLLYNEASAVRFGPSSGEP